MRISSMRTTVANVIQYYEYNAIHVLFVSMTRAITAIIEEIYHFHKIYQLISKRS